MKQKTPPWMVPSFDNALSQLTRDLDSPDSQVRISALKTWIGIWESLSPWQPREDDSQ